MDILSLLFGTPAKVKLTKLFVFNPEWVLSREDIITKAKVSVREAKANLAILVKMGLIKKRAAGYGLDQELELLKPLREFLLATGAINDKEIIGRLSRAGKLKFVVVAGVFLHDWDGRVDLVVVGDNIKTSVAENAIRSIEADMGRELQYVIFETDDFKYRYGMYDKLVRDILDFNHQVLLDKIALK